MELNLHRDPGTLHVNALPPKAYYIPYESLEKAKKGNREESGRFQSLCGTWGFEWFSSEDDLPDFFGPGYTPKETLPVPSSWQMFLGRGYDVPLYTNIRYPFPVDPPSCPRKTPAGFIPAGFG